jgi:hypothetical protein
VCGDGLVEQDEMHIFDEDPFCTWKCDGNAGSKFYEKEVGQKSWALIVFVVADVPPKWIHDGAFH